MTKKHVAYIDENRKLFQFGNVVVKDDKYSKVMVDTLPPSHLFKLREDFPRYEGEDQWEVDPACKNGLLALARKAVGDEVAKKIMQGFDYKGGLVPLKISDQLNHQWDFQSLDFIAYPYNGFSDRGEHEAFLILVSSHIRKTIKWGRELKEKLEQEEVQDIYEFLKERNGTN